MQKGIGLEQQPDLKAIIDALTQMGGDAMQSAIDAFNKANSVPQLQCPFYGAEEVYCQYYDTAGNYHWTGTITGEHIVRM